MTISRILITGDILRPHTADATRSESVTRVRWLQDLLTPPLSAATGLPVGRLTADAPPLEFAALYADCGTTPSDDAWAALYAGELSPALEQRMVDACHDALVIGIELPPSMSRALARAGIPLIDCIVHPLRFLFDIPLGWRSTVPAVRDTFGPFGVTDFEIQRRAAQIRAKMRWLGGAPVEPGTTLVLDQLPTDAAMIDPRQGRRVGWADYVDQLRGLKAAGPVLWRPHPYNPEAGLLSQVLGEDTRISANFYGLLSLDGLARVAAMSSGGVVEARAFGKEGLHFLDRNAGIDLPGWASPVPVVGHWLSPHFWSAVLAPLVETRRDVPELQVERDFFRRANNTDWDFGWIDQVVERRSADERRETEIALRMAESERCLAESGSRIAELTQQVAALARERDCLRQRADLNDQRADLNDQRVHRLMNAEKHRIRAVMDKVVAAARTNRWRVGVLGAGSHTEWLLHETDLGSVSPLFIFDANPSARGRRIAGMPVQPASDIPRMNLQAVIVSSVAFQDEMVAYLEALPFSTGEIVRCYP